MQSQQPPKACSKDKKTGTSLELMKCEGWARSNNTIVPERIPRAVLQREIADFIPQLTFVYIYIFFFSFAPFLCSRFGLFGLEATWQLLLPGPLSQLSACFKSSLLCQGMCSTVLAENFAPCAPELVGSVARPWTFRVPLFMPAFGGGKGDKLFPRGMLEVPATASLTNHIVGVDPKVVLSQSCCASSASFCTGCIGHYGLCAPIGVQPDWFEELALFQGLVCAHELAVEPVCHFLWLGQGNETCRPASTECAESPMAQFAGTSCPALATPFLVL